MPPGIKILTTPPQRGAPTAQTPGLEDFLKYGWNQTYTSEALYTHIQAASDLHPLLGALADSGPAPIDQHGPSLYINSKSDQIGCDDYIPFLFAQLKDPHIPVNSMNIWRQNFLEARNLPILMNALSSFPNVCVLNPHTVKCNESQFISLVGSYPNLQNLETQDIDIREYESANSAHADPMEATSVTPREMSDGQQGPEIQGISIYVDNTTGWIFLDLFASRRSLVALCNLSKLTLRHRSRVICNDNNFVRRLSHIIRLCPILWEIYIDSFNIITPLEPLNLGTAINHVYVFLTDKNFETNMTVNWWASTPHQLKSPRHLSRVTIEMEVDIENISRASWNKFPTKVPRWAMLDEALTRPQLKVDKVSLVMFESLRVREGFSMSAFSTWLSMKYGRKFLTTH
ncbi:uncharacterized protein BT62DRAFT_935130 [Guyanagaster necrorhizus]|uniref:Uncharacterized protein n=1 Tax=Guyanagaster necrorhizus TaxID=856835 RepID=A0A9P7VLS0_9AGAR|nr:uncharacterized protein BT62DRAFT_935130 [Guyanagaster necrorhizus MCA 3950]KAG7443521.1 hypothetical protein BT62DRAFT_935130 [Guyanagaster necrorhizus MCA 3950]